MNVPPAASPMPVRFARWLLRCAVRHWPKDTRVWGMALAAEIDATSRTLDALRWSWGGIMLFARSVVTSVWSWLKLPAGTLPSGKTDPSGGPVLPRRSRLSTVCVLAAGIVLLSLPLGRQAMMMVRDSWSDSEFRLSAPERWELDNLAARAAKENDVATLAFVALRADDPERCEALADRAVSLNPDFVWLYAARNWPKGTPMLQQHMARLRASDPDNAVPLLLAADAEAQRVEDKQQPRTYEDQLTLLASDYEWMNLMAQASTAPRYDSYLQRHSELTFSLWSRERYLSPSLALIRLSTQHIPNLLNIRTFSKIQIREAEKAAAVGDWNEADRMLSEVDLFAERVVSANSTKIEKLIAWALARDANQERVKLYAAAGRAADTKKAELRIHQIDEIINVAARKPHDGRYQAFRRWGILLQGFGVVAAMAGCAGFVAVLLLEFLQANRSRRRTQWRRLLPWLADYAPAVFLLASSGFLMSFLPYAHAISSSFAWSNGLRNEDLISDALLGVIAVPRFLLQPVLIWSSITAGLAAIAILITGRSIYRNKQLTRSQI
jgi:hypothetical protein